MPINLGGSLRAAAQWLVALALIIAIIIFGVVILPAAVTFLCIAYAILLLAACAIRALIGVWRWLSACSWHK